MRLLSIILSICVFYTINTYSQCVVIVDTSNLQHVICPNGGSNGGANISQTGYQNFAWHNVTNGQIYGNGPGITSLQNLDAGAYVITASNPYNSTCPLVSYSDTFVILEPTVDIQFSPTQACPGLCNVSVNIDLISPIPQINYGFILDNGPQNSIGSNIANQCGGIHQYQIFASGTGCGVQTFGISQFAQMNLATTVVNATCSQTGSATVNITGVGASALNSYCASIPQYTNYSTVNYVYLSGDNNSIVNNTINQCDTYEDYTNQFADVTPGNQYSIQVDLGTCHPTGISLIDFANVYVDWNIDGDFDDLNELIGQIPPSQSPSSHILNFTVPIGAIPGQARLRIVAQNNQYQPNNQANACDNGTSWFGATEDYTININGSVANPVSYLWSNGQTTQTASNLSAGTYLISITDANGCIAVDTAIVSGSGNVSVDAGNNQTICYGGTPSSLSSSSSSMSGTYQWSNANHFIDPNVANPIFNSNLYTTTTYIVTYTDLNGCIAYDSVTVFVNPSVSVSISALPSISCIGNNIQLTANTSVPVIRYRFQYNDGSGWQNITTNTPWGWGVLNPVNFNSINTTTQFRVRVREDWGCDPSLWSPIITVPINNVLTPPISHN